MTLATIAIPTYNRAVLLDRAVTSALAQDHAEVEVVIVDNASTDDTAEFCARRAAADPRVRYVRQPQNVSAVANFDTAVAGARGRYFMWLADDDWLAPNYLSACIARLESGAVLAAGRCQWFDGEAVSDEKPVRLLDADPADRVRALYRVVIKNSTFYGVSRTADARVASRSLHGVGGDWFVVAAYAMAGPVDTVDTTRINRSGGGESDGLTRAWRSLPIAVGRDILCSPPYGGLPHLLRARLAARCATVTAWRLGVWFPLLAGLRRLLPEALYLGVWRLYRRLRGARPAAAPDE